MIAVNLRNKITVKITKIISKKYYFYDNLLLDFKGKCNHQNFKNFCHLTFSLFIKFSKFPKHGN